ncbi:hypothetical protein C5167_011868 [Papaver somniferum]|uniref:Uncharacterized protein n=1 Tax=Papaver somniferum TaxID=3469 RepID=A0A4Y7IZT7_PAPSO|nr:hypothetical protein C5167_011868 [Papaver somniferum]
MESCKIISDSEAPKLNRKNYNIRRHRIITRSSSSGSDENNGFSPAPSRVFREGKNFLNDRMQEGFLQRIRYAMKPDEAFGLTFSWDNVVVNHSITTQCLNLCFLQ